MRFVSCNIRKCTLCLIIGTLQTLSSQHINQSLVGTLWISKDLWLYENREDNNHTLCRCKGFSESSLDKHDDCHHVKMSVQNVHLPATPLDKPMF